ncbi:MAG: linear amide C-N hydrolase [Candidatus Aminicenantes bacterium]|nr:linear amide C-N hydrolase [Candidatus Aminicenantes bacterium]
MRTSRTFGSFITLILCMVIFQPVLNACTTFFLKNGSRMVFGRNYDWHTGVGYVMVNKRNVVKKAMNNDDPTQTPAEWVSLYGSVTFNQYGREYPMGGMNEAGLVVEVMWMAGTRFPDTDGRPALGELPWVQYQLDTCRSVEEVLATDKHIRISADSSPIHYLIGDAAGRTATVEFLDGKMVAHTGEILPYSVLANDTYADSLRYLRQHEGFGGKTAISDTERSLDRFAKACAGVTGYDTTKNPNIIDYAINILDEVSQEKGTMWSIVYDVGHRTVYFKTIQRPALKSFALADFDFSCESGTRIIDMNTARTGNLAPHFVPYSRDMNRQLIGASFGSTDFLKEIPAEALDELARYPESLPCRPPRTPGIHQITTTNSGGSTLRYTLSIPDTYDPEKPQPLVVALHYGGEVTPFYGRGYLKLLVLPALKGLNALILAPDCPDRSWTSPVSETAVIGLIKALLSDYKIDERKILLTGFSLGGIGTYHLAARHPGLFSAAIPMAARTTEETLALIHNIPFYIIHSDGDELFPMESVEAIVKTLKEKGMKVQLQVIRGISHWRTTAFVPALRQAASWVKNIWDKDTSGHALPLPCVRSAYSCPLKPEISINPSYLKAINTY